MASLEPKSRQDDLNPASRSDDTVGLPTRLATLATHLRTVYGSVKRPLAFFLILIVLLGSVVPITAVQVAAIGLLGFIILEALFDIQAKLINKNPRPVFAEFFEATNAIKHFIIREIERKQTVQIRALGMSMGHAWPFLLNTLIPLLESETPQTVELHIAMLDGDWEELDKINPDWSSRAKTNYNEILRFVESHKARLTAKKWTLTVHKYRHMPNWHGILINNEFLFLSVCFWKNDRLTGAENQYELLSAKDPDLGKHRIAQFLTWFEFVRADKGREFQQVSK